MRSNSENFFKGKKTSVTSLLISFLYTNQLHVIPSLNKIINKHLRKMSYNNTKLFYSSCFCVHDIPLSVNLSPYPFP